MDFRWRFSAAIRAYTLSVLAGVGAFRFEVARFSETIRTALQAKNFFLLRPDSWALESRG